MDELLILQQYMEFCFEFDSSLQQYIANFHSCTMHLDTIKVFIHQPMHERIALKRILKFTLKQLLHVSVQSLSSGSIFFERAKVIMIKIII